jgi:UDP-N-acetylmuramoyl-tripeptide--D-alanyl-D-alanine ligase
MNTEALYALYKEHPLVTTDSRKCPEGSIFFALKGESFDGNNYALQALEKGCAFAVVDNPEVANRDERLFLVPDVLKALQELAAYHRKMWGKTVLQITGTNGKTTTKELISAVLSEGKNVLYTEGNLNNHIGVPLTLLRIKPEHDIAVIETGANHPGEIADLCRIVEADFGLITNVGRAHLEGFGSFEGVKQTKGELYDDLLGRGKKLFLNALDNDLLQMAQSRGIVLKDNAIPYIEGRVSKVTPFVEMQWRSEDETWHTVKTNLIGAYNIANLRAAVTVGLHFGIKPEQIDHALSAYKPTNSRSELREVGSNSLIVDAYNANPSSMSAALTNFSFFEDKHKMVILGDMRELGAESLEEHKRIVKQLQEMKLEHIWLVGSEFAKAATEGMRVFKDVEEVKDALKAEPIANSTILIKGSNSTKLHQLPDFI